MSEWIEELEKEINILEQGKVEIELAIREDAGHSNGESFVSMIEKLEEWKKTKVKLDKLYKLRTALEDKH